ncbi:hypothetical protein SAMN05421671_0052 [Pimelobacter simplex]|nr:hypothetical protein SAMN05421671_0052 [Pimelobacter simplex]
MARMFGVSSQTISAWKRCQARMPMASQLRVIKATGVTLDDLTAALAEDEHRIADWVAARREEEDEGGGEGDAGGAPAKTPPGSGPDRPPLLAVASGDEGDEKLAREATEQARRARAEQMEAIAEMKRKKKGREK